MQAKKYACQLIEKKWLTPTVMGIRILPGKKFDYEAGQFLSVLVPADFGGGRQVKRAYSFASAPNEGTYELCVKYVPGGKGTEYLKSLNVGDELTVFAPYGHFSYEPGKSRALCLVATGSGIAPFRGMVMSERFREAPPTRTTLLFGGREEGDVVYPGLFESAGIETVVALTRPGQKWEGFRGRVTDYLRTLPSHWGWHSTDFYICGNAEMANDVMSILKGNGVPEAAIHAEVFFLGAAKEREAMKRAEEKKPVTPPKFTKVPKAA